MPAQLTHPERCFIHHGLFQRPYFLHDFDNFVVHSASLAESEVPSYVRFAFPCLYPCQPNFGRYWPLFGAYAVHSMLDCWFSTGSANQPQGGKGGPSPLLRFPGGGRGFWGEERGPKGPYKRAFLARAGN